jgi:hypothetical protein
MTNYEQAATSLLPESPDGTRMAVLAGSVF